jgi:hypothetical protein
MTLLVHLFLQLGQLDLGMSLRRCRLPQVPQLPGQRVGAGEDDRSERPAGTLLDAP